LEIDILGLIQLQDCDKKIKQASNKKKLGPIKIQGLEEKLGEGEMKFQKEYDLLDSLQKERRAIGQDVQELESKADKSKTKLENIKSNKEYTAALKEIDNIVKEKTQIEDREIQLMEEIESLEKKCKEYKSDQAELRKKFEQEKKNIETEIKKLDRELKLFEKEKKKITDSINKNILSTYNFLIERKNGLAIGPVIEGVCKSCHMKLPPQKYNELMKGELMQTCPNCNRIIYWGENEKFIMKSGEI